MQLTSVADAPKLKESSADDFEKFVSWSVPVATKAQCNHNSELRLLKQPWWKKLGLENEDSQYNDEVLL